MTQQMIKLRVYSRTSSSLSAKIADWTEKDRIERQNASHRLSRFLYRFVLKTRDAAVFRVYVVQIVGFGERIADESYRESD